MHILVIDRHYREQLARAAVQSRTPAELHTACDKLWTRYQKQYLFSGAIGTHNARCCLDSIPWWLQRLSSTPAPMSREYARLLSRTHAKLACLDLVPPRAYPDKLPYDLELLERLLSDFYGDLDDRALRNAVIDHMQQIQASVLR